ncbi:MAG: type I-C CRISPR-associated protein Cas8c/Csd1 [Armatimonadota bacterium]
MILQRLCEFARRVPDIPPSMYSPLYFKWQIELGEQGNYKGLTPLFDGEKSQRGLQVVVPNRKRTSKPVPLLLADTADYVLGLGSDSPADSVRLHYFKQLVEKCAEVTGEPSVRAVANFLNNYERNPSTIPDEDIQKIDPSDRIIFRVGNQRPTDLPTVQQFWAQECIEESSQEMQCIVCGRTGQVDRVSPISIMGIPGGQPSGTQIVSANKEAFESYGLEQALTAPTCRSCGEAYANAINYMLGSNTHHVTVDPVAFVFWTVGESQFSPASFFAKPEPDEVRKLIESYRTGREQRGISPEAFYSLALSASGGRAVVRDWIVSTVPNVQANLARWFALQRIVKPDRVSTDSYLYFGIRKLARSLYPSKGRADKISANTLRTLVRCALHGAPIPTWILAQAVQRNRAEQQVTHERAAIIKAALLIQMNNLEEGFMERLEPTYKSPGYLLCGRLMAELEAAQEHATDPKARLVNRYYGAASSSPATVFGYLLRDFQVAHMAKLRKERPGAYFAIDKRVQEILKDLQDFPRTLSLREQALFSLGYYHQKAKIGRMPRHGQNSES